MGFVQRVMGAAEKGRVQKCTVVSKVELKYRAKRVRADSQIVWSKPDHNKEIFVEHNGMVGSVIPSNGWYEWTVDDLDGNNIEAGDHRSLDEAKKIVESILTTSTGR